MASELGNKVSELKKSKNKDQQNTYNLLVNMLKNLRENYLACSLEDRELAHLLGVSKPQVARLKQSVNLLLQTEVLNQWFNPKYFLDLRTAFKECGEDLPPLSFQHLLSIALDSTPDRAKWSLEFRMANPCIEVSDYQIADGIEGTIQVCTREEWNSRPPSWSGFEDMAIPNIIVLIYEKTTQGWFVEAIGSKTNNQPDTILAGLLNLDGVEGINIRVKKTTLEPTGRISNRIREVLTDPNIRAKGFVSEIGHSLKRHHYTILSKGSPEKDEILSILKSEGWLYPVEDERITWRPLLPFFVLCYAQDFSEEEKRKFETEGLSDKTEIKSYQYLSKEQYNLSLPIPYTVSSDPLFPFQEGDIVKVSLQGKSLVVTISDEKTENKGK